MLPLVIPPYSRASQHEGQYITGMRYIMKHASAMRDKGGRYVFLIKAYHQRSVVGRKMRTILLLFAGVLVLNCLPWFIPKDEKQVPTGAFFAGAIAVFDKTRKGPAISYIGRDELEACGEAFLAQVRQQAEKTGQGDGGMKLILPFPPSVNTYWRHPNKGAFAGKSLISEAGRKFQSAACAAIIEQLRRLPKPTSAPASVEIVLFPPDNRIRDLDNYNKALFDALTHAGVWEDDSQVKRMLVEWGPVIPKGKVEITISKYEKTAGAAA
ncbi:RusA family crossover junction endodeoxyribonuclease [Escherichia coli]|nr:RusA family crossover junction endodeoxyribonuclease [Escherichia coli]